MGGKEPCENWPLPYVHTLFGFCAGKLGWNRWLGATGAIEMTLPSSGKNSSQRWWANTSPGGRPSIGPLPVTGFLKLGSAGLAVKSVWYDKRLAGRSLANFPVN